MHLHVGLEVRHLIPHLLNRHRTGQTLTPGLRFECAEDQVLSPFGMVTSQAVDQVVHFGLVRNQHLAYDAESARLPQHDQSD